jgi:small-conductance mechanosensitive channel
MKDLLNNPLITENQKFFVWLAIFAGSLLLTLFVKSVIHTIGKRWQKYADSTRLKLDDALAMGFADTKSFAIFIWIFYGLSSFAEPDPSLVKTLRSLVVISTTIQAGIWGRDALRFWEGSYIQRRIKTDASSASAMRLITTTMNAAFFVALFLICLSNLGVDIGALLAGLGIGGVAIALAAQNVLGDLFASLSIVLDKPFVVGDYIVVGNDQGTVENIGIKTTRVRSLTGEELIFANKDLLESRVKNFKRMWKRRVALKVNVAYDTPLEKLKILPKWFEDKIKNIKDLSFERSHLAEYGNSTLTFETIFWVNNSDYNAYMDLQQEILFSMIEKFTQEGIGFALPVQVFKNEMTAYVDEDDDDDGIPEREHSLEN